MTCPVCGTNHPCAHTRTSTAVLSDPEVFNSPAIAARGRADQEHWRQEVITRVRQHRARRRGFDPNASLELDFTAAEPLVMSQPPVVSQTAGELAQPMGRLANPPPAGAVRPRARKIIRFPGLGPVQLADAVKPAGVDRELEMELAAPAPDTPRILDAPEPEQMELLPSFADIRLEEAPRETSLSEDLDWPAQPASLRRRLASGLVDGAIVLAALGVFAAPFAATLARLAENVPQTRPALLCALAAGATLWLLFQYLFLVYGKKTPGMGAAHLELLTFDGKLPSVFARGSRALAATLSGFSLGLGFAWALVDEHTLGWHDRISQTYLRSSN